LLPKFREEPFLNDCHRGARAKLSAMFLSTLRVLEKHDWKLGLRVLPALILC
jgi:hypothetical protein